MTTLHRWRHLAYLLWKYGTRNVVSAVHDYNERPRSLVYTPSSSSAANVKVSWAAILPPPPR